jgi:PPOX class probable F420-dependent enzyme
VEALSKVELLAYVRLHKLAVIATVAEDGAPQSALVGIGSTSELEIVFDTLSTTRKHRNLQRDPRIAVTFSGPGETTAQIEGIARPVSPGVAADAAYLDAYYAAWPDGRERAIWPSLVYWRMVPRWARYSDFARGPLIAELRWPER